MPYKIALVLSPYRLLTDHLIIEWLRITKSNGILNYASTDIDEAYTGGLLNSLPRETRTALQAFGRGGIAQSKIAVRQQYALRKAGVSFEAFYQSAIARKLHGQLEKLKPYAAMLKWYHKIPKDKTHFQTTPCTLSDIRPQLQFDIVEEDGALLVQPLVAINGTVYPLAEFHRFQFLLERNQVYYILYFKDYRSLDWLESTDPAQYSRHPRQLEQEILSVLENDYRVNRNGYFEKNCIEGIPENRVMLSEISNSFLVLTPQWVYEGILVEGPWSETHESTVDGETFLVRRNREAESAFSTLLESFHTNFAKQLNGYFYLSFAEAQKKQWFPKTYHRLLEENIQVMGMDMLQHFRYSPHRITTVFTQHECEQNTISLQMEAAFGAEAVPLHELQKTIRNGQRAVLLKDGSLGLLHEEWLQQYGLLLRHGKVTGKTILVSRWLAFTEQDMPENTEVLKPVLGRYWWQKWTQWQDDNGTVYPLPGTVTASLRAYQQKGFEWMALLAEAGAGACLADDMGLGKTLQTICFIAHRLLQNPAAQHLIICPASLIYNWQEELRKFAPSIVAGLYYGASRSLNNQTGQPQVIVTSYGTARADIELLAAISFDVVVLDESHNIKNPAAQVTRAVGQLQAAIRIALSGTPVMNNTFDLYAQLNFVLPGLFGSREGFKREYADAIDRGHDQEKINALQKITTPFLLRRTKEQVAADLPPKTETVMWCEMDASQKQLYESIKSNIRESLFLNIKTEGLAKSKMALLQAILRLRQVCNSPLLLPPGEQTSSASVKTTMLIEELKGNLAGHKVLVFSQFAKMLDILSEECSKNGIAHFHFDGQTPVAKRQEMVAAFQDGNNHTNLFLISLKAGNAGLNLTAAGYVFLFDPWWNTAVQQQAIDRTHRIGQQKNVFAYKMICRDTIEEKILALQQQKKQLADDLITEEEGFVKSLTKEDIEYLFN